ncbi:hypothetical protein N665_0262s0014 [Sinapis alba]|nr:hypothetical protein N665_0262s0014 [Sinapis alba]
MSSSSSSLSHSRRPTPHGVPNSCWCGQGLVTLVSLTKKNPHRRFYRCQIALQRKDESHLFKWEDEAFLDELRMADAERMDLLHDFQALSKSTAEHLKQLQLRFDQREAEMRTIMDHHIALLNEEHRFYKEQSTMKIKDIVDETINNKLTGITTTNNKNGYNIVVVLAVLGSLSWLYGKLSY